MVMQRIFTQRDDAGNLLAINRANDGNMYLVTEDAKHLASLPIDEDEAARIFAEKGRSFVQTVPLSPFGRHMRDMCGRNTGYSL